MQKEIILKQQAIEILQRRFAQQRTAVRDIDTRLEDYLDHICTYSDSIPGSDKDLHNTYEILGAVKFLRLLRTYDFNEKKVRQVIRLREGEWAQMDTGRWQHVKGGLKQPGTTGAQVFRWQPFQVYVLASVFGFQTLIDTQRTGDADLLPTEQRGADGHIYDLRRLCTDFTYYGPRKTDKTGLSAYIQDVFFLMEDYNSEAYCCANSADQAKLLYRRAKLMLQELNADNQWRLTETVCDWRPAYKSVRDSSIRPLSAGGKTKDGMFAQLCCADEYGSAAYTNGKSDMKMLVDVVQSSMGPRREPLTFTTTTAGRIQTGPFIEKLDSLRRMLEQEIDFDAAQSSRDNVIPESRNNEEAARNNDKGDASPTLSTDRILCLILEPDLWEREDEDTLLTDHRIRRKVNPMLGIIAQHQFYDDEIAKARVSGDMDEVKTKLFNTYVSGKAVDWVKPERIRKLQGTRRIDQCPLADGWEVYVGMDFSQGNDIHAATYLAERWNSEGECEYFADLDAWINEKTLRESSIRDLYELWIEQGWLRVSEGEVFQPNLPVQRIRELDQKDVSFVGFGYDPHLSKEPINELKAWLQSLGPKADDLVVPISQTLGAFNPAVDRLTYLLQTDDIKFEFSASPLWPWEFGNCVLDVDNRMGNRKPVKRNPGSDACKVDNVQCLCECFLVEELMEGK